MEGHMQTKNLHAIWEAPDNSRLTAKQFTVRLPIRVAAQIEALSEMYPRKTKTDLIGDLLAAALDELEDTLPVKEVGDVLGIDENEEPIRKAIGPRVTFRALRDKYLKEFEKEVEGEEHEPEQTTFPQRGRGKGKSAAKLRTR
jgi:predicted DNA-binding protein